MAKRLINPALVPLKLLMFLLHGGISSLLPFMGIHMKSLGLSVAETAIILTLLPFISAIGPPIGGILADKLGNYKVVFVTTIVTSSILHVLLYFVVPSVAPEAAMLLGSTVTTPRPNGYLPPADRLTVLATYSVLRVLAFTIMFAGVSLADSAAVVMVKEQGAQLGPQRMFSTLGFCLMPPISSFLLEWVKRRNGWEDYGPAFYLQAGMHLAAAVAILFLKMENRLPAQNLAANMGKLLKDRRVLSLIFVVFLNGCGFGVVTSFLFWFMEEELLSNKVALGLTQTVAGIFGFPAMFFAAPVIRWLGHSRIYALGLACYAIRFLGMSYIPAGEMNAYWVLPLQALEAISHSLLIVAAADHAGQLSPKFVASLQGLTFAAHYCFGKGGGSMIGGLLRDFFGWRRCFQYLAIIFAAACVLYLLIDYFFIYRYRNAMKAKDEKRAMHEAEEAERKEKLLTGTVSAVSEYQYPQKDGDVIYRQSGSTSDPRDLRKNDL